MACIQNSAYIGVLFVSVSGVGTLHYFVYSLSTSPTPIIFDKFHFFFPLFILQCMLLFVSGMWFIQPWNILLQIKLCIDSVCMILNLYLYARTFILRFMIYQCTCVCMLSFMEVPFSNYRNICDLEFRRVPCLLTTKPLYFNNLI